MTSNRLRPLLIPSLAAVLALAGCTSDDARAAVTPPPAPAADVAKVCAALHRELPETVAGRDRIDPEPASDLTAAWGGAAIVLRCGVPRPAKMDDPMALGAEWDGVGWMAEELRSGGVRFTSTYREAYVEVVVAQGVATEVGVLDPIVAAVKKTVPPTV
ncbi:DUF3515 domain-containing protein [Streptomyces sp. NPDC089919]|uniref:DUF3515 domain-containing protein n=1 Tax=Streptomyces sp. NPDC089919 TaxID=3155188 RepID=UPI00343BD0D7